jgi:hypothetical protein
LPFRTGTFADASAFTMVAGGDSLESNARADLLPLEIKAWSAILFLQSRAFPAKAAGGRQRHYCRRDAAAPWRACCGL